MEKEVDHEEVRQERLREAGRQKKAEAIETVSLILGIFWSRVIAPAHASLSSHQARLQAQQKKEWADQKKSKRYENLFTDEAFEDRAAQEDSDDDFM